MSDSQADDAGDDIAYPGAIPFVLVHMACFAAFWTGVTPETVALGVGLYWLRIFAIGAGYHRYFAHRAFKTSRTAQFVLAFLAETTAQKGVLWWAGKHRRHHKYSDTEHDLHSPARRGFLYAHVGWVFARRNDGTDIELMRDFAAFPELRWLDRHYYVPPTVLGVLCFLLAGWPGVVVGFCWSTVVVWHATFSINSVAHVVGRRRYVTGDYSRNNWWLAVLTMGEGWHNNHHAYQSSVRQGFRWWQYDPTYYLLKAMSWVGLVWDLHAPPRDVIRGERRLGGSVIDKAAAQLAASFPLERLVSEAQQALARTPSWAELRTRALEARRAAETFLAETELPHLPSLEEVRAYARTKLAATPSLDEISTRARQRLRELVSARLIDAATASAAG